MGLHNNLIFSTLFLALLLLKAVASLGPTAATTAPAGTVIPVWFDSSNAGHRDIQYHPEQPARITACVKALRHESCVQLFDVAPEPVSLSNDDDEKETEKVEPPARPILYAPFSDAELQAARAILLQTHEATLVEGLERQCTQARERRIADGKDPLGHMGYMDTGDTYVTTETWGVVLRATATWMRAVDAVMSSSSSSSSSESNSSNKGNAPPLAAFALTRPPGHHATRSESNGFCLVNFAAAAALYAVQQQQQPCHSVAILDWDVHYGQGVADIVGAQRQLLIGNENREGSSSSSIRYVSTHQVGFEHDPICVINCNKVSHISSITFPGTCLSVHGTNSSTFTQQYGHDFANASGYHVDMWVPSLVSKST